MDLLNIIIIAIALAMDASSVGLSLSASGYLKDKRAIFRIAFHFGLFQFIMPILGWAAGRQFVDYFSSIDHWIAFFLLLFVGIRMIQAGLSKSDEKILKDPSKGVSLITLSLATSMDALAVGLSLAMLEVNIWYPSVIIGAITSLLTLMAIGLGKFFGKLFGRRMEIIGGLILIAIGTRILLTHFG